ncbi:MAG TPA: UDP-N-acetylglucosamine 2-epimerase (non-hydrolyzing) [Cytophagaceae bacterium]|jgi:UDP-N-acetylglucosamine 2-epimerase (non-hydrolysing)|nr:UDP-N-acetylglucosamine 2-epimerase (non-hydrolyzing) [Cytophagaceae bacterium]
MKSLLFVIGTRPEAIKLAPLILLFSKSEKYQVKICVTSQHRILLDQVLTFFSIKPDYDLNLMKPDQSLSQLTSEILTGMEPVLKEVNPDLLFVQGDTTSAFVAALAGFYKKIKIAHIEAGLRTYHKYSPFPEEMNRILTSKLCDYHFVPTKRAMDNLLSEGIRENCYLVGNTITDALQLGLSIVKENEQVYKEYFSGIEFSKKIILVTCHRREIFGEPFKEICKALSILANQNDDVQFVYPVHLNPAINLPAHSYLNHKNIVLLEPLSYPYLIWLMHKSYLVMTDSGGIQEEAPSLGIPVLVLREVTERVEGIEAGTAKLVGINAESIVRETSKLLNDMAVHKSMAKAVNPYGNATTSQKIMDIVDRIGEKES